MDISLTRRRVGSPGLATMIRPGLPSGSGVEMIPPPGAAPSPECLGRSLLTGSGAAPAPQESVDGAARAEPAQAPPTEGRGQGQLGCDREKPGLAHEEKTLTEKLTHVSSR